MRIAIEFRGQAMHPPAPIHNTPTPQQLSRDSVLLLPWKTAAVAAPEEQSCSGRAAVSVQNELWVSQRTACSR